MKSTRKERCFVNLIWKVKKLKEEKTNIVEEIDAMLANFSEILELFQDRIINYVKEKVESLVKEKNEIIGFRTTRRLEVD